MSMRKIRRTKTAAKAEKLWKAVIRRRSSEIHRGQAKLRPAEDVMRDALKAIS